MELKGIQSAQSFQIFLMKAILLIALIGTAFCSNTFLAPEINRKDATNFLLGFALGLGVLYEIPDVAACAQDAAHAQSTVATAIAEIETGKVDQIIDGVQLLTSFLSEVSQTCGNTVVEANAYVGNLRRIVFSPDFPKAAVQNVLKNLKVTVDDVVQLLKEDDWVMKGAYAGDIAKIVLFGEPNDK